MQPQQERPEASPPTTPRTNLPSRSATASWLSGTKITDGAPRAPGQESSWVDLSNLEKIAEKHGLDLASDWETLLQMPPGDALTEFDLAQPDDETPFLDQSCGESEPPGAIGACPPGKFTNATIDWNTGRIEADFEPDQEKEKSPSKLLEGLVAYWRMDEEAKEPVVVGPKFVRVDHQHPINVTTNAEDGDAPLPEKGYASAVYPYEPPPRAHTFCVTIDDTTDYEISREYESTLRALCGALCMAPSKDQMLSVCGLVDELKAEKRETEFRISTLKRKLADVTASNRSNFEIGVIFGIWAIVATIILIALWAS